MKNIIEDVRNQFRLEKLRKKQFIRQLNVQEFFLEKKKNKVNKDIILKDIRNLSDNEEEEENYYKAVQAVIVSNFWSNNYIEYESKFDRILVE